MNSGTEEAARNLRDALEILRRQDDPFAKQFWLSTGDDPQGDLAMLSNPVAMQSATVVRVIGVRVESGQKNPMEILCMFIPGMCVNGYMAGVCVSAIERRSETSSISADYTLGRYIRQEDSGETIVGSTHLFGGSIQELSQRYITYFRHDSTSVRYHLTAVTRPGASFQAIFEDFIAGNRKELASHFSFVESSRQKRRTGCLVCSLSFCNCELELVKPSATLDFRAFPRHFVDDFGSFESKAMICVQIADTNGGQQAGETSTTSVSFMRYQGPPEYVMSKQVLDQNLPGMLQELALQDRMGQQNILRVTMPTSAEGQIVPVSSPIARRVSTLESCKYTQQVRTLPNTDNIGRTVTEGQQLCPTQLTKSPVISGFLPNFGFESTQNFSSERGNENDSMQALKGEFALSVEDKLTRDIDIFGVAGSASFDCSYAQGSHSLTNFASPRLPREFPPMMPEGNMDTLLQETEAVFQGQVEGSGTSAGIRVLANEQMARKNDHRPDVVVSLQNDGKRGLKLSESDKDAIRRERNRIAATKSNAKRKLGMDTLKTDLANAKEKVRNLLEREAVLRSQNAELRNEALRGFRTSF